MSYKDINKQREYQRIYNKEKRENWIKSRGPCKNCESDKNLEIHHLDPNKKRKISWSMNPLWLMRELSKCIILCKGCHKIETKKQRIRNLVHGTKTGYDYGCRCKECTEATVKQKQERRNFLKAIGRK